MRIADVLTNPKKFALCVAFVLPALFVSGCGGGGTSSVPSTPATPTAQVEPTTQATSATKTTPTPFVTAIPRATPSPATIVGRVACVGDSITYGLGLAERSTTSYPAVLGRWLGANSEVQNFGVNGATLLGVGNRPYQQQAALARALEFKPNVLVVALGTNDSNYPFDTQVETDFERAYKSLIAAFKQSNSAVKIYLCLPTPSFPLNNKHNVTLSTTILPLIEQVAQNTKSDMIDLNAPFIEQPELLADGVHPNASGATRIASFVYRAIAGRETP